MRSPANSLRAAKLCVAVLMTATALIGPAAASGAGTRLLVKFQPSVSGVEASAALADQGASQLRRIPDIGVRVISVPSGRAAAARSRLARSPRVRFVELDAVAKPQETIPNDPYFPQGSYSIQAGAWGWYLTHTTRAWDLTEGDPRVIIAILDTGLKPGALDFDGQLVAGHDVLDGTADTATNAGSHGTYVAGVAGLAIDNGSGNAGYCPGCKIMPVQVGTDSGATYSNMATGIIWAVDHGARVLNLSWAGTGPSATLTSAVAYARSKGAVVFAAAGNSNCDCPKYPAATPGVLGVAGVTAAGAKAGDSNYGSWVAIAAPESNMTVWPTINGAPGFGPVGGTSLAAPAAAGIAGLLFSADPGLSGSQVEAALRGSAAPVSFALGGGRIDALAALESLGFSDPQPAGAPRNTIAPQVLVQTNGRDNAAPLGAAPQPGQVLVRGQGAWSGSAPLSLSAVRWYRCNLDGGACSQVGSLWKYTVQAADVDSVLKMTVTFGNGYGTVSVSAPLTAPVDGAAPPPPPPAPPVNASPPLVSGVAEEGRGLTASAGSWSNSPTSFAYQWRRCDGAGAACASISGATLPSYSLTAADVGSTLEVAVTAANAGGSASATSAPTAPVAAAPSPSPVKQTLTFAGSFSSKTTSRSYAVKAGAGTATARLSFSKCPSMTLSLADSSGTVLAGAGGASVLSLDRTLAAGGYSYAISGSSRCSYTLTIDSAAP